MSTPWGGLPEFPVQRTHETMDSHSIRPLVSIVLPTLNAGKFLGECLQSIAGQSVQEYEVLVIDGGSEDETLLICRDFEKVRVVSQQSKGLTGAWNEGIGQAEGEYVALLDSDDIWLPDTLENHIATLVAHPEKLASIGHMSFFLDNDQQVPPGFKISLLDQTHLAYMPGCFVGKPTIFETLGLFEMHWKILSDLVWFDRLKARPDLFAVCHHEVLRKRVHMGNLSYNTAAQTDTYKKELLQYVRRKMQNSTPS